jgi:hypothetical protein
MLTPDRDGVVALLQAVLEGQQAILAELAALREQQTGRSVPIGVDGDAQIGLQLAAIGAPGWRTAAELYDLRLSDPGLSDALENALVDTPQQLAALLLRLHKRNLADRSARRGRSGWLWRLSR